MEDRQSLGHSLYVRDLIDMSCSVGEIHKFGKEKVITSKPSESELFPFASLLFMKFPRDLELTKTVSW